MNPSPLPYCFKFNQCELEEIVNFSSNLHEYVNLLNENSVDIVQSPISEYNEDDGGVGEEDEVEEIEQGVYDASQATQHKRMANYTN